MLFSSNSLNDGLVYGKVTLKRYPNHSVKAYADKYDFDIKPWSNPLNWGRNLETIIGKKKAGEGVPFEINNIKRTLYYVRTVSFFVCKTCKIYIGYVKKVYRICKNTFQ